MSEPVCSTCQDTHTMRLTKDGDVDQLVSCTRCPSPCEKCRGLISGFRTSAYCHETPCLCMCHASRHQAREAPDEPPWRVGRSLGRTIYFDNRCVGIVDTPGFAAMLVSAANKAWEQIEGNNNGSQEDKNSSPEARREVQGGAAHPAAGTSMGEGRGDQDGPAVVVTPPAQSHPEAGEVGGGVTLRAFKLMVRRVGGTAVMTEHDLNRADRFQLRWTSDGHNTTVTTIDDT